MVSFIVNTSDTHERACQSQAPPHTAATHGPFGKRQNPAFSLLPGSSRYPTPRLLGHACNWRIYGSLGNWRRRRDFNANRSGANKYFQRGIPRKIYVAGMLRQGKLWHRWNRLAGNCSLDLRHFGHGCLHPKSPLSSKPIAASEMIPANCRR